MDIDTFWQIIDETRAASDGDPKKQSDLLVDRLAQLSQNEILDFEQTRLVFHYRAFRADLWDAAFVIGCGCDDDQFSDFRGWLIQQGKTVYEEALEDPQSLLNVVERGSDIQSDVLYWVADKAWERKTGDETLLLIDGPTYPLRYIGSMLPTPEEKYTRYPKLTEKFRPQCDEEPKT
jgi:hypothetical protein